MDYKLLVTPHHFPSSIRFHRGWEEFQFGTQKNKAVIKWYFCGGTALFGVALVLQGFLIIREGNFLVLARRAARLVTDRLVDRPEPSFLACVVRDDVFVLVVSLLSSSSSSSSSSPSPSSSAFILVASFACWYSSSSFTTFRTVMLFLLRGMNMIKRW